ncbi:MAG: DUF853 family protein, partial [Bacteroidaceae bacterium]|nr:DUF853 family protein [Bacteroidaceae bacterium]
EAIIELQTGEALVSFLDEKGAPAMVERARILFPLSQIGAVTEAQRDKIIKQSRVYGRYDKLIDRESAFEVLLAENEKALQMEAEEQAELAAEKEASKSKKKGGLLGGVFGAVVGAVITSITGSVATEVANKVTGKKTRSGGVKGAVNRATKTATSTALRKLTRDILGNLIR